VEPIGISAANVAPKTPHLVNRIIIEAQQYIPRSFTKSL
jgi:hypothetical protein